VEERYERLRAWRKGRAQARKVEVQVIAPNAVLWAIARTDPRDPAALAQVEGMDAFRVEQYGAEILALLKQTPAQPQQQKLL
jgi:ribonuclease D